MSNRYHEGSWIGVDLDGTLAEYHGWVRVTYVGPPIPAMVERVKQWLSEGIEVRILTARVGPMQNETDVTLARAAITGWCKRHIGQSLRVVCEKDLKMFELWDDRCVCVERNTGRILGRNASE